MLFTDAGRNGWRAGTSWRGTSGTSLDVSGGLRHEQRTGEDVKSWQAMLRLPVRVARLADISASFRGFDGPWLSGSSPSLRFSRRIGGANWSLDAGRFAYTGKSTDTTRDNNWAELGASRELAAGWDASASYRRDWGGDITGRRLYLELARRF